LIKIIERIAYEVSCDEVKLMVDKLKNGDDDLKRELLRIYSVGTFYFWERVAIAPTIHRLRRQGTKTTIVETIFSGMQEDIRDSINIKPPYVPGKTIYQDRT
jgi:hypothetical protein